MSRLRASSSIPEQHKTRRRNSQPSHTRGDLADERPNDRFGNKETDKRDRRGKPHRDGTFLQPTNLAELWEKQGGSRSFAAVACRQ